MKVEYGIRPNCSEWDEWIEPEDEWILPTVKAEIKKATEQARTQVKDWDR
jgi:hypothetical protein